MGNIALVFVIGCNGIALGVIADRLGVLVKAYLRVHRLEEER